MKPSALFTDLYELTMAQAYTAEQMNQLAVFELAFRKVPANRNYIVAAGIGDGFEDQELDYLRQRREFTETFLKWLEDLRSTGDVYALPEGTLVFPNEPIVQVVAPIIEAQLMETLVLNQGHFQSLAAAKAARVVEAAKGRGVVDFGSRRAPGTDAALKVARATLGLTAVITDPTKVVARREVPIECEATDSEALLVEWLNVLVYEMAVRRMIFSSFVVNAEGCRLRGSAWGEEIDVARHEPAVEVKGATYTSLFVGQNSDGAWIAQCVVDVRDRQMETTLLQRVSDSEWRIEPQGKMRVPAILFASRELIRDMDAKVYEQIVNVQTGSPASGVGETMTEIEIRQAIFDALHQIAPEADLQKIRPEENLRETLDIDSFDSLNVLIGLHARLGVEVPEADYGQLTTLSALVRYVSRKLAGE
jgi:SHS2 domain-containing protein/acyl carrier protein